MVSSEPGRLLTSTSRLAALWRASRRVYPELGIRNIIRRIRYVREAETIWPALSRLLRAPPGSPLDRHITDRPQILAFVEAPYIHAGWDAAKRLGVFQRQFDYLQDMGAAFDFGPALSIELMKIEELGPDYLIVMDKPAWFQREGLLALNIFRENIRLFTLSFSFDRDGDDRVLMIGAVQGRRIEGALEEYRQLTKLACGMRPRDLLIDIVRMLAKSVGATKMMGISDGQRHHRSPYFGLDTARELPLDYDEIWRDRGGVERGDGFFDLPLKRQVRPLEEISSKKRSMYRARYAMMDRIEEQLNERLPRLRPVRRPEAD